jgi:hypothetical protein
MPASARTAFDGTRPDDHSYMTVSAVGATDMHASARMSRREVCREFDRRLRLDPASRIAAAAAAAV